MAPSVLAGIGCSRYERVVFEALLTNLDVALGETMLPWRLQPHGDGDSHWPVAQLLLRAGGREIPHRAMWFVVHVGQAMR